MIYRKFILSTEVEPEVEPEVDPWAPVNVFQGAEEPPPPKKKSGKIIRLPPALAAKLKEQCPG